MPAQQAELTINAIEWEAINLNLHLPDQGSFDKMVIYLEAVYDHMKAFSRPHGPPYQQKAESVRINLAIFTGLTRQGSINTLQGKG